MEPTKPPADVPPKPASQPPAANSARALGCPPARLRGIQFGILSSSTIARRLSVITDRDERNYKVGIQKAQDLFDPRLGIPNKEQNCATCGGTRRGRGDLPGTCDGHFGHTVLAAPIYHPLYMRSLPKLLSSICLGCSRVLEKKKRKNDLQEIFDRESGDEEEGSENLAVRKVAPKRKLGAGVNGAASRKRKRTSKNLSKWLMEDLERGVMNQEWAHSSMLDSSNVEFPLQQGCKAESMEIPKASFPGDAPDPPVPGRGKRMLPNDMESMICKYCGGPDGDGSKFPKIKVKLLSKVVGKRTRVDTIQMVVDEKAGDLPSGFWDFVNGNPLGAQAKTRTLLAPEAWKILKRMPTETTLVSNPATFVISHLLVSPNCNRLVMEDWSSTLQPRVLQKKSGQTNKLDAIVRKSSQIRESLGSFHRMDFNESVRISEELQPLVARHFRAYKVVEYKPSTGQEIEETGGTLESKWFKANVLAKLTNYCARTVVNGDPYIRIEEIGIPEEIAQRLTVEEKINTLNIRTWQKFVDDYLVSDDLSMPGALMLKKNKENTQRDLELLRIASKDQHIKLDLGDRITRRLKDGDHVFVNRPPSLHKHSLVTLKVKVHALSTFSINPLICPPFDADFDGDSFHVFVPQSLESKAETQELMTVYAQMISSQGGQPIIGLTQDSLVAGHLLTSGHVFINRNDMEQLSMWCTSQIPIPAIVKSPSKTGRLWTGKQLFSMTLPGGLNFGTSHWTGTPLGMTIPLKQIYSAEGNVLIRDGEVLLCQGGSKWLDRSPNGVLRAMCYHAGPVATVEHLDCLQAVLHQWLLITGFSVGLRDFYAAERPEERKRMLKGVQKSLEKSNEASLKQAIRRDRQYQHRRSFPEQGGISGLTDVEEHQGCFGLLLGDEKCTPAVAALQVAAIEKFQALAPDIENLVTGYMDQKNSLLAMVRSGSKGSMAKLTQQVGCLGLQLYKGQRLLPIKRNNKLSYTHTSQECQSDVFSQTKAEAGLEGYWESRSIIANSYLDGLNAREFFMDTLSSRCNMLRQGIEEPNLILRNLMLFLRDISISYDGTVRFGSGQSIIQFRYGTGKRSSLGTDPGQPVPSSYGSSDSSLACEDPEDPEDQWAVSELAGEPVGALAATSIAEPAYNVKMQAVHQAQVLGTGPVQLLKEVLTVRSKTKMKVNDRRSILRLPQGFGIERRALEIQRKLQRVTLEQITLTCAIEYVRLDKRMYVKNATAKDGLPFLRLSPWIGHIQLCKKTLDQNLLSISSIVEILNKKHTGKAGEDSYEIYFSYSDRCKSKVHPNDVGHCIWFFLVNPPETVAVTTKELYQEKMALLLGSMKTILPAVLNSTIRGCDNLEKVRIFWEDSGSPSRLPEEKSLGGQHSIYQARRPDRGELVVEVVVKEPKGAGKRGAPWLTLQEACVPVMDLIDWRRSTPYAIQEICKIYGVEAARHVILKRLVLATKVMGSPVSRKHMMLVADTMTHCGEVTGLCPAGYREFCRHMSISAPFTEAAVQQPKKTFLAAAAKGASENIDGVLISAVWGSRIPIGTGVAFQINPKVCRIPTQKWQRDPLELWEKLRETKAKAVVRAKSKSTQENSHVRKSIKTQSLFQKSKQTRIYLDLLEDLELTGTPIFQDGKLARVMLGKGNDFTKATIFQYGDEGEIEDCVESFQDMTKSPATNENALPDSHEEDEHESPQQTATVLQDGINEGCNGIVEGNKKRTGCEQVLESSEEGLEHESTQETPNALQDGTNERCNGIVEEGITGVLPIVSDKRTGCKRVLECLEEEGTDDQPSTKLVKKHVGPVLPPVEDDIAILRVNDSRKVTWSGCADVPVAAEELKVVDCTDDNSNISSEEASENNLTPTADEISEALTRFNGAKGPPSSVAGSVTPNNGYVSKGESGHKSSVPSSKRMWPLNLPGRILHPFRKFFNMPSKNGEDRRVQETEEPPHVVDVGSGDAGTTTTGGTCQSRTEVLNDGFNQQQHTPLSPGHTGRRDPAPSEVVAHSEFEHMILDQKRMLQNLLHVRYRVGERVQADIEKMIVEDVLAHHPQREEKIGCGVDYIKVDYHPDHPTTKCFHIARKDGSCTDFSFHKCLDSKNEWLTNCSQLFDVS